MSLTPVQPLGGLLVKREDLFRPYGAGDVNGGKLRQCRELLLSRRPSAVYTACSIHSPQAPICAAVAEELGIPCTVLYGGTSAQRLLDMPMPRLALMHGGRVKIAAHTGRHNVLYAKARQMAVGSGGLVVEYGFNMREGGEVVSAVADQCANVPAGLERVCVTCGSGVSAYGLLTGFARYGNAPKELHLYATAPSRAGLLGSAPQVCRLVFHDLFHEPGFLYERGEPMSWCGVELHPNYEAKSMRRMVREGWPEGTLFWVVGAYPKAAERRGSRPR